ncbi:MAG: glucosaminidase domain-containing protein [Pseudoflavonifractor sp.]|nr:glucosaminidase domain-containing protein [Alloprevotella sp.]MCM1117732.1 glucosaminidase domain-containing protein [Pseudoflavonifractor sp.]
MRRLLPALLALAFLAAAHLSAAHRVAPAQEEEAAAGVDDLLSIIGPTEVSADRMWAFVAAVNPDFPISIAHAYYEIGRRYGIRGDVALCQSIIETGWFRFTGGTAVTPDQHNYCGLGVTSLGVKGHAFETIESGVTAQMQHLYAYATRRSLPKGEKVVDPRFKLVSRGTAPTWKSLNRRWAANDHYGETILALFRRLLADDPPTAEEVTELEMQVGIPDDLLE